MILMVHGYGLSGSGSNLWTRAVVRALCQQGRDVHLACRERRPEMYEFVSEVFDYDREGNRQLALDRSSQLAGRCIIHRPSVDVLPVFVRPQAGATGMASILDLDDDAIEDYLERGANAVHTVLTNHDIDGVHVNHVVLMSEAVRRACRKTGHPFAVMPHGSAIEYIVRRSDEMQRLASKVLREADRILILNEEMRRRIDEVFPEVEGAHQKMIHVPVGVDVGQFRAVSKERRAENIQQLKDRVVGMDRGRTLDQEDTLFDSVPGDLSLDAAKKVVDAGAQYPHRQPDAGLEKKLDSVDWGAAPVVGYVGRLLGHKGVHNILLAFPLIIQKHPRAVLLLAGSGPQRELLEMLRAALARGHRAVVRSLMEWGEALEGEELRPYPEAVAFLNSIAEEGEEDAYFDAAGRLAERDRVIYTGYLEHSELCLVFPCADVGVFPSVVKEASPLVVPEALASGVIPMGIDHAGMSASLDDAEIALPSEVRPLMRIRPEAEHVVRDIAKNVTEILTYEFDLATDLHAFAADRYDWQNIARSMADELSRLPMHTV